MVKTDTKMERLIRTDKKMAADGWRVQPRVVTGRRDSQKAGRAGTCATPSASRPAMDTQRLAISLQIPNASSGAGRQVEIADGESAFTPLLLQARPRPGSCCARRQRDIS